MYRRCMKCEGCRAYRNEVHVPNTNSHSEAIERFRRETHHGPVLPVSQLPDQSQRFVDIARAIGIPDIFHRPILDFDILRRRLNHTRAAGSQALSTQVLKCATSVGTQGRKPYQDPLFWMFGIWRLFRKAARPPASIQYAQELARQHALQTGNAPASYTHRSMAAWACRRSAPQHEIGEICRQICDQSGTGDNAKTYTFPRRQTSTWLTWLGTACNLYVPIPDQESGTTTHHSDRWQKLGTSHLDALLVLELLQDPQRTVARNDKNYSIFRQHRAQQR